MITYFVNSKLHNTVPFPSECTCILVIITRHQPQLFNIIRAEADMMFLSIETQQQEVAVDGGVSMDI